MATKLFFHSFASGTNPSTKFQRGLNTNKLNGSAGLWLPKGMDTTQGAAVASVTVTTVAGPTSGIEVVSGTSTVEWISEPLDADTTISGTITFNLRAAESSMTANAAINCRIERVDSQGLIISEIVKTARVTELGTTEAAENFTATPTSTNMLKGDRLRFTVFADDAGTMGTGFTVTFWHDGAAGATGDSYVSFTETFGFLALPVSGTIMYLTDVAGPAVGANIEKEMWTARGDGINTAVVNTANGWTHLQLTDTAGGTAIEWYSRPLAAFTLSGFAVANLWGKVSSLSSKASIKAELAVCNEDGSGAVIYGTDANSDSAGGALGTTSAAAALAIAGDDTAVTDRQRLRVRVYAIPLSNAAMVTGFTETLSYDGVTGGADGDSYLQLTQTITEAVAAPPRYPAINHCDPALV